MQNAHIESEIIRNCCNLSVSEPLDTVDMKREQEVDLAIKSGTLPPHTVNLMTIFNYTGHIISNTSNNSLRYYASVWLKRLGENHTNPIKKACL
jgi:hypothetical protein